MSRLPTNAPRRLPIPPIDNDDERRNEDFGIHAGIEAENGPRRDAAERRERDAEAEHAAEQRRNVAAKAGRHRGIVDARAHHGADAAALEKQPEQQRDRKAEADQEQAVRREDSRADLHGALQHLRHRKPLHGSAPDRLHQIQKDEGKSERQQHLVHVAAAIERPHEHALDHDPGSDHRDRRKDERQPEAAGRAKDRQAQIGARA